MTPVFGSANNRQNESPAKMVNLGCGGRFHSRWINLDIASYSPEVRQHDLRTPLPFEGGTCQVVYHSHVLEHFARPFAPRFLSECFRILAVGGIIRVVVPDLETIVRLYLRFLDEARNGDEQAAFKHEWMTLELLDQMVRECSGGRMLEYWKQNPMPAEAFVIERMGQEVLGFLETMRAKPPGPPTSKIPPTLAEMVQFRESGEIHKWMYDAFSLSQLLKNAGFVEIRRCAANESRIPEFNSFLLDTNSDGSVRKPDSLFMEAIKP